MENHFDVGPWDQGFEPPNPELDSDDTGIEPPGLDSELASPEPDRPDPVVEPPVLRSGRRLPWRMAPKRWRALDGAHRRLRRAGATLDRAASRSGWPLPFSPIRFLVLARLHGASAFGIRPRRLARRMAMKPSSLAHHLRILEEAGLIDRSRRAGAHDARRVVARLTERGLEALWALDRALEEEFGDEEDEMPGEASEAAPPPR